MDEFGKLLAQGQTGEIVIRGDNVTAGYENNLAANESAFISGWLRTGDQGYLDGSGYLTITGRLKEIINRGGEKISPREIDEALVEHPGVALATAFMVPHSTLGEDIVAAVVLHPGTTVTPEELRSFLFETLTDYKVPSRILLLDAIPKGSTGKIQRLTLAEKLEKHLESEYIAPSSEIEKKLASIIKKTLGCELVGLNHNFFALGGDSLRATQVVSLINETYQLELPLPSLFHHPTVKELANLVNEKCTERDAHIAQLVSEIENLSDEEVERLLDQNGK
jgi:acyl carrier protein